MELIFKNTTLAAYGEESGVGSRYRSNSQFGNCIKPGTHDGSLDWSRSCGVGWGGAGRVRSEERPNDLFRLDHEAARHEVG